MTWLYSAGKIPLTTGDADPTAVRLQDEFRLADISPNDHRQRSISLLAQNRCCQQFLKLLRDSLRKAVNCIHAFERDNLGSLANAQRSGASRRLFAAKCCTQSRVTRDRPQLYPIENPLSLRQHLAAKHKPCSAVDDIITTVKHLKSGAGISGTLLNLRATI